jgi:hypothetical protein
MSDEIVRFSSHWNLWEAELVRARLAAENVPSRLGSAALVLWAWYYGNAVGGVTVDVSARDVEAARGIVARDDQEPAESQSPWVCPACGTRGVPTWDTCWNCGAYCDGTVSPEFDQDGGIQSAAPESARDRGGCSLLGVIVAMAAAAAYAIGGILVLLAMVLLAVVTVLVFYEWSEETTPSRTEDGTNETAPDFHGATRPYRTRSGNSIVERAWRASVLGSFSFPPLTLYSIWLLSRLILRRTRLRGGDRLRCVVALVLAVPWALAIVVVPLMWAYSAIASHWAWQP